MSFQGIRLIDLWEYSDITIRETVPVCAFAIPVGIAALLLFPPPALSADSATATATVQIEKATSGISSVSNFLFGAPVAEPTEEAVDTVEATDETESDEFLQQLRDAVRTLSTIEPARFSVFGSPNQVFSVTLPQTATLSSESSGGNVTVSDFLHDAGVTPMVGGGGFTSFSVGAGAQASLDSGTGTGTDNDTGTDVGDTGSENGEVEADATDPSESPSDPFDPDAETPGFLNVSVSYN
jgi:hypothetical protein